MPVDDDVPTTAPEDGNISSRLTRNRTSGSEEVLLAASSWEFIGMATEHGSFDPSCPVDAYEIEVSHNKWQRAAPKLMAPLPPSTSASTIPIEFSGVACDAQVDFSIRGDTPPVLRNLSAGVPTNMVSYPWGNVPYEWCAGFDNLVLFHTEVDCGVYCDVLTSLEAADDPSYHQAMRGEDRLHWYDAREDELGALKNLGVIVLTPADAVPSGTDIYDTMMLCKRKRGADNKVTKHKMSCLLCGNQVVAVSARRAEVLGTEGVPPLRTHSPTILSLGCRACRACQCLSGYCRATFGLLSGLTCLTPVGCPVGACRGLSGLSGQVGVKQCASTVGHCQAVKLLSSCRAVGAVKHCRAVRLLSSCRAVRHCWGCQALLGLSLLSGLQGIFIHVLTRCGLPIFQPFRQPASAHQVFPKWEQSPVYAYLQGPHRLLGYGKWHHTHMAKLVDLTPQWDTNPVTHCKHLLSKAGYSRHPT